jgi:hypothetical protein
VILNGAYRQYSGHRVYLVGAAQIDPELPFITAAADGQSSGKPTFARDGAMKNFRLSRNLKEI